MSASPELARLVRELRARVELSDGFEWAAAANDIKTLKPAAADAGGVRGGISEQLAELARTVSACRKCPLGAQRLNPAFGVGSHAAEVMFIGEGPGYEEDRRGEPFVGKAGQLLDRILASIGLSRQSVYIANIVKCHPMIDPFDPQRRGNDRPPTPPEMEACRGYLDEQIRLIRPRFLVALGATASKTLIGTQTGISRLRGKWHEYLSIPLLPTYHPAALLRDPGLKREVWSDMKDLKKALERES